MDFTDLKLDLSSVKLDILRGIHQCSERGLFQSLKWLSELNFALEDVPVTPEELRPPVEDGGAEYSTFLLAKSYFNVKEYDRSAYFVRNCTTPKALFLHYYSQYLSIEKKKLDSMTDTNCPPDPTQNEELKTLCAELKNHFYDNKLDGFCSYLYGVVLKKLDLKSLAIDMLVKAVQEEPILWSAWFELGKMMGDKYEHVLSSLPDHWMRSFFTAHLYLEQLNNDEALNIYQKLSSEGFESSTYVMSQIALGFHNNRSMFLFQKPAVVFIKLVFDFRAC